MAKPRALKRWVPVMRHMRAAPGVKPGNARDSGQIGAQRIMVDENLGKDVSRSLPGRCGQGETRRNQPSRSDTGSGRGGCSSAQTARPRVPRPRHRRAQYRAGGNCNHRGRKSGGDQAGAAGNRPDGIRVLGRCPRRAAGGGDDRPVTCLPRRGGDTGLRAVHVHPAPGRVHRSCSRRQMTRAEFLRAMAKAS